MMHLTRPIVGAVGLALLVGCAATDAKLADLTKVETSAIPEFNIASTFSVAQSASNLHRAYTSDFFYVLSGKYVGYKANAQGTLYIGTQPSIWEHIVLSNGKSANFVSFGGVWIPTNPKLTPRLFVLPRQQAKIGGETPITEAFARESANNLASQLSSPSKTLYPQAASGVNSVVVNQVSQSNVTPGQAGLAGAVAIGVIEILDKVETKVEVVFVGPEVMPTDALAQIRKSILTRSAN